MTSLTGLIFMLGLTAVLFSLSACMALSGDAWHWRKEKPMVEKLAPPRKVIIGTVMHNFWEKYPGVDKRLDKIEELIDQVAAESARKYPGEKLDLIVLPEEAVTTARSPEAAKRAVPLKGAVQDRMSAKAIQHNTYLIVPMALVEEKKKALYTNAAVLFDRKGKVAGIYRKVHPVTDYGTKVLEGGITPGTDFPVFDCDFGKLGIQICWDMSYEDGWKALAKKGAEIVALPTAAPQTARPSTFASRGKYYIVSATPSNNASVFDPVGMVQAQITKNETVLVHQIDLSYALLHWSPKLLGGKSFTRKYGKRAGFVYYESEGTGLFWSNDPKLPVGQMVTDLNFIEMAPYVELNRRAQDTARGGPPEDAKTK